MDNDIKKLTDAMTKHFVDDSENFEKINKANELQDQDHKNFYLRLGEIQKHQEETKAFMENLSGVSDLVRGAGLLKKPSLWLLAFVVGLVALFGGFKAIIGWFILK